MVKAAEAEAEAKYLQGQGISRQRQVGMRVWRLGADAGGMGPGWWERLWLTQRHVYRPHAPAPTRRLA